MPLHAGRTCTWQAVSAFADRLPRLDRPPVGPLLRLWAPCRVRASCARPCSSSACACSRSAFRNFSSASFRPARHVFWVVDNGSSHRGQASADRLRSAFPQRAHDPPARACSWLNQIEICFSVLQRKVLTPNDFTDLAEVEARLLCFQDHSKQVATPFEWKFTRADLLFKRIDAHEPHRPQPDPIRVRISVPEH